MFKFPTEICKLCRISVHCQVTLVMRGMITVTTTMMTEIGTTVTKETGGTVMAMLRRWDSTTSSSSVWTAGKFCFVPLLSCFWISVIISHA